MPLKKSAVGLLLAGIACLLTLRALAHPETPSVAPLAMPQAQEAAPNRREFALVARDYRFSPARIEVAQDDLVKLTIQSADVAYSLTIDAYRVSRRIPAGGSTTLEFRADRPGTFPFYSDLTSDARHAQMRGELIVRAR